MAKTYLEVHVHANILVLDYAESLGGTWASERLYPGLKTNNVVGTYEFSDFPLVPKEYGIEPGQHIPGRVVYSYLCDFCDAFGLTSRIRFGTKVDSATLLPNGEWQVAFTSTTKPEAGVYEVVSGDSLTTAGTDEKWSGTLVASKLVLATGLTSEPFIPRLPGREKFNGPVFHAKDFKSRAQELAAAKTVVVIGGNKSAWDVCYTTSARLGAKAHMVMRRSGGGPSWCWPAQSISAISATRLFTWLDPNPYGGSALLLRRLIKSTWLGRKLSGLFWDYLDGKVTGINAYDESPGLANLKPWTSTFWMGNSLSIHNYETSWFDLARNGQITTHAAEVSSLSETAVHLSDGTVIEADAVVCCTGWETKPSVKFFPESLGDGLGFPSANTNTGDRVLEAKVRAEILRSTPALRKKPVRQLPNSLRPEMKLPSELPATAPEKAVGSSSSPYRLYRFVLPCDPDIIRMKNLAVIGAHITLQTALVSQVQALWITAFFDGKIPNLVTTSQDSQLKYEAVKRETYYHTEYQRIRRPKEAGGTGDRCPDLVFDSIPYADVLLSDLGLSCHRKSSWYKEITEPYGVNDFKGLVNEWLRKASRG